MLVDIITMAVSDPGLPEGAVKHSILLIPKRHYDLIKIQT